MTDSITPDNSRQVPSIRVAPLGDLNAYMVHEHELDTIAAGSPATLAFNFAIALVSIGVTFVLALTTTTIASDRLYYSYLIVCVNCLLAGVILFGYWLKTHTSVSRMVKQIKSRMDVLAPVQEDA